MTIHLTPEIESALSEAASRRGTTPELLALDYLRHQFLPLQREPDASSGTLADFLAGHVGVLASSEFVPSGAQMSASPGKRFAEGLLEKRRQGRL